MAETALIVVVPEAEPLVRELRTRYDESARLGVPAHITVLFPFMSPSELSPRVLGELKRLFLGQAAFGFQLGSVARFPATSYLEPHPSDPFVALTEAVWRAYPNFPPFGREFPSIIPHLTVAHGNALEATAASQAVSAGLAKRGPVAPLAAPLSSWRIRPVVGGACMNSSSPRNQEPNPSIERTPSSKLRLLPVAAHVER